MQIEHLIVAKVHAFVTIVNFAERVGASQGREHLFGFVSLEVTIDQLFSVSAAIISALSYSTTVEKC